MSGWFFTYPNVRARQFLCVSIQGDSNTLADLVERDHSEAMSLFIDRAEAILHSSFGDSYYWEARRSMRYAKHLVEIGDKFRSEKLNSNDVSDKTVLDKSWDETKKAIGGPFVCIHWRRRDFVHSHSAHIPSIEGTAELVKKFCDGFSFMFFHSFLLDADETFAWNYKRQMTALEL
ncbi:unnamed protein product [Anisakis simplex]|uniref:GDP-fucose protein O-fucosyltransferase 2 n=1 Tax=Anisakis simplex TaxID=6269 RepID=A0A0M3JAK7_ANISI|nr:unnamed protein product [Anisakis simplex]